MHSLSLNAAASLSAMAAFSVLVVSDTGYELFAIALLWYFASSVCCLLMSLFACLATDLRPVHFWRDNAYLSVAVAMPAALMASLAPISWGWVFDAARGWFSAPFAGGVGVVTMSVVVVATVHWFRYIARADWVAARIVSVSVPRDWRWYLALGVPYWLLCAIFFGIGILTAIAQSL